MKLKAFVTSITVMAMTFISVTVMAYDCPYKDNDVNMQREQQLHRPQMRMKAENQHFNKAKAYKMHKRFKHGDMAKKFKKHGQIGFRGDGKANIRHKKMDARKHSRHRGNRSIKINGDIYNQNFFIIVPRHDEDDGQDEGGEGGENDNDDSDFSFHRHNFKKNDMKEKRECFKDLMQKRLAE